MSKLLETIHSPEDLQRLNREQLPQLAQEIREHIIDVVYQTGGHLGSALGVVELTLALHYIYNFAHDRLVFDTGHQCYPHKILTGRRLQFSSLRQKNGLYGFPSTKESKFDHFTTGHAGNAIASVLGLKTGADLLGKKRYTVAVVGDAAIQSGVAFEAINAAGALQKDMLVVLNDNEWSIAKSVGALATYFSKLRTDPLFTKGKEELHHFLKAIPFVGEQIDKKVDQLADLARKAIVPGHVFEAFGVHYYGPIDGHDLPTLLDMLERVKKIDGVVLLHLLTQKGKGGKGAENDPQRLHGISPAKKSVQRKIEGQQIVVKPKPVKAWTQAFSEIMVKLAQKNKKLCAITAGMPDGTGLNEFAQAYKERFFDVGICEQHGVAFSAGLAKEGMRPVVAIYSTFLQRAYDQVFQEILLSGHPVVFAMDRSGLVGEDGPTHHGIFDIAYLRTIPGICCLAPRDATELEQMLLWGLQQEQAVAIRYPRAAVPDPEIQNIRLPMQAGRGEILRDGADALVLAYGVFAQNAMDAAEILSNKGLQFTVVNARFAKPLDESWYRRMLTAYRRVFTLEEHSLAGGFGSAILELAAKLDLEGKIIPYGIPDRFIMHAPRAEQIRELGLDAQSLARSWEASLAAEPVR